MNKLNQSKRVQIVASLVEGNSLRATARMCDVAFNTVLKLLPEIGRACAEYQDKALRNLTCQRIQCDEIWSFCYAKEKNVPAEMREKGGVGSVWTWVAIDADTKLVPCWRIGGRNAWHAQHFMYDLASRLANRVQLTTDGSRLGQRLTTRCWLNFTETTLAERIAATARLSALDAGKPKSSDGLN
jgi:IS1 family transposase